jgi:hypothetical protein
MKILCKKIVLTCVFVLLNFFAFSQGPPNPPLDPGAGNDPVGGSVPVGSGLSLLFLMTGAYGIYKTYKAFISEIEEEKI